MLSPALLAEVGGDSARLLALPRLHSETFRSAWPQWAARVGLVLPPSSLDREFEHNSYMLEACAAGLGVAVTAWAFAAADLERGRLAAPFGFAARADRYVFLRPNLSRNPAAERMSEWLQQEGRLAAAPPPSIDMLSTAQLRHERTLALVRKPGVHSTSRIACL